MKQLAGQISFFEPLKPWEERVFDHVLQRGSGFEMGKVRIYDQFRKGESAGRNVEFLRREYGIGGASDCFEGEDLIQSYNGKGIAVDSWGKKIIVSWTWQEVERRLRDLVGSGQYLTEEQRQAMIEEDAETKRRCAEWYAKRRKEK